MQITIGDILILFTLAVVFLLAVSAIVRGYREMKRSKSFDASNGKMKTGYWLLSGIHMWAGIIVTLCYILAGILIVTSFLGG